MCDRSCRIEAPPLGREQRHPVVKLDFAAGDFSSTERLEAAVLARLETECEGADIGVRHDLAASRLAALLRGLREQNGGRRVVVLVDEYDKPILDNLNSPEVVSSNRDFLSGLYGTFKALDAEIRFVLLTGVSKFFGTGGRPPEGG